MSQAGNVAPRCSGFTLIELSMVIVIIGLLIGGVMVGRDMIAGAEVRKVHKEYETISTAVQTFKSKYNCLPGDCNHATDFFEADVCPIATDGTPGAPAGYLNLTPQEATCDGDGDGRIDAYGTLYEMTLLWQHLANAKLIPGIYSGGIDWGGGGMASRINVPPVAAFSENHFWFAADGDNWEVLVFASSPYPGLGLVPGNYGTMMGLGTQNMSTLPFTPLTLKSFDEKFDDGDPLNGRIVVGRDFMGTRPPCTDAADETITDASNMGAQYNIDPAYKNGNHCGPGYITRW